MADHEWFVPPWVEHGLDDPDHLSRSADVDKGDSDWNVDSTSTPLTDDAILEPLQEQFGQIRSKARVRDLAEVFTNKREIDAMLASVLPAFSHLDAKFLEPSAGNGNFLVEILARKLELATKKNAKSQEHFEHRLLRAIASIYAVDISLDNVSEARTRMAHALVSHFNSDAPGVRPTRAFLNAAALILGDNIVLGDSLTRAEEIELCEWVPAAGAKFQRIWSPAVVAPENRDLFWTERVQDKDPIHYSGLVPAGHTHEIHVLKTGAAK